jgi:hypothetical protein
MAKQLTPSGWDYVNDIAEKYHCNGGCEIDDYTLQSTILQILDLHIPDVDVFRLARIYRSLYAV